MTKAFVYLAAAALLLAFGNTAVPARAEAPLSAEASKRPRSLDEFREMWLRSNKLMPDFVAYDLDGKPVKVSDFRGKVVLMDFWFTTCHMCIKGMPGMHEIATAYGPQGLVVLAVGMPEKREDFEKFVRANQAKYPKFVWAQDRSSEQMENGVAMKQLGLIGAPSQFLLDREGRIVAASNFEDQVLLNLPLAGIEVDEAVLAKARKGEADREERVRKNRQTGR